MTANEEAMSRSCELLEMTGRVWRAAFRLAIYSPHGHGCEIYGAAEQATQRGMRGMESFHHRAEELLAERLQLGAPHVASGFVRPMPDFES